MDPKRVPLKILHCSSGEPEKTQSLGPYQIESLIDETQEGVGTVYRVRIAPHQQTNVSYHRLAEEYYFVLSGRGMALLNGQEFPLKSGDFLRLPPGTHHAFVTFDEPLEMLDIHTPGCRPNRDTYFVDEVPDGFEPPKSE